MGGQGVGPGPSGQGARPDEDRARYVGDTAPRAVRPSPGTGFADADASLAAARFVILGLPYGATVSHRFGTDLGPAAIRQASWNLETLNLRNGVDATAVPVHDAGDVELQGLSPEKMADAVYAAARPLARARKFIVALGGEHSTSPNVIRAVAEQHPNLRVLQLDAHLDYRDSYEGTRHNHACAVKRIIDAVGEGRVGAIGIRSAEGAELAEAKREGHVFYTAWEVERRGMSAVLDECLRRIGALDDAPLFLTLDIDGIDPAYAPATGTPEPFGLTPFDVLRVITRTAHQLVGFDVNEVAPPFDAGNTASLAARLVREVVTEAHLKQARGPPSGGHDV